MIKNIEKRYFKLALVLVIGGCFLFYAIRAIGGHGHGDGSHGKYKSGANYMRPHGGHGSEHTYPSFSHILKNAGRLGLNEDQISKIKAVQLDHKKAVIRSTAEIKIILLEMGNIFHSGSFDEANILRKSDEHIELTAKKMRSRTEEMVNVLKILTPEQIKKIQELHVMGRKGTEGPDHSKRMGEGKGHFQQSPH